MMITTTVRLLLYVNVYRVIHATGFKPYNYDLSFRAQYQIVGLMNSFSVCEELQ